MAIIGHACAHGKLGACEECLGAIAASIPLYSQADLDDAVAKATKDLQWQLDEVLRERDSGIALSVAAEREAIMQSIEARRKRHGTLCDCKAFAVLGVVLDDLRSRGPKT